jgi:glycogen operon protein
MVIITQDSPDFPYTVSGGSHLALGAVHDGEGVNFAVYSEHASKIELCLFSEDGKTELFRIILPEKTGSIWHGYIAGLAIGALYGYRAYGRYEPDKGHRFNPNKLLLDPYTREIHGQWTTHVATLGFDSHSPNADKSFSTIDSAPYVAKSVVSDPALFCKNQNYKHKYKNRSHVDSAKPKSADGSRDLIYEIHVKGATQTNRRVPEAVRGTYEGLCSDAMILHMLELGVSALELLPVHSFVDDIFLETRGLRNYWGYNSIGFFAAEPRYFGPDGLAGFRKMIAKLHEAGIAVILDVVYNHTAEGDQRGPTLSFRGLDNASYYRLKEDQPRYYINDTGCGNCLNISNPYVLRMVLDSLRFWVECMGVDGFRFDLATTIAREKQGFDPQGGFLDALRQDPVLREVILIAEPWDIGPGGYQLGQFPDEFREWNDQYRDTVRRYWRGDEHSAQALGARLLGSAGKFDHRGRRANASVNFVTSHDGFTLADVASYNDKHNEANIENNRDGHHANYSDNCGVEGVTSNPDILAQRAQRQRNILTTLFLSQGTPMLLAGDELGNSQAGNNNAYCQDNEISWLNWEKSDRQLCDFVASLSAFRQAHSAVRQSRFLHGAIRKHDGFADVEWRDFKGQPVRWRDAYLSNLCLLLRGSAEVPAYEVDCDPVFIAFNRQHSQQQLLLPNAPQQMSWIKALDSSQIVQKFTAEEHQTYGDYRLVNSESVVVFVLRSKEMHQ